MEDHLPIAWIMDGGTPCSAKEVAPPARMDCPATDESKNRRRRRVKKERVGTWPLAVSHNGDANGKRRSRDPRYARKWARGL